MTHTRTRPTHHAGRPCRQSIADCLYGYNLRIEHLHEFDANPYRRRAKAGGTNQTRTRQKEKVN